MNYPLELGDAALLSLAEIKEEQGAKNEQIGNKG